MKESMRQIRARLGWPALSDAERGRNLNDGVSDFLDDMLDGKPVLIVDSPALRRALRRRARERAREE